MNRRFAFERAGRTVIKDGLNQPSMARPSKAHRPKRRWIGVELGPQFEHRAQIEDALGALFEVKVRLMDALSPLQSAMDRSVWPVLG